MDKHKVGQCIAQCRKARHITQEQLAQMLDVSDKSVSKWENGHCLPDSSLFEPLCHILGLTPNELFAGKRSIDDGFESDMDKILLDMLKRRLYVLSDRNVSYSDFSNALTRLASFYHQLRKFPTKDAAVDRWMQETDTSRDECANAYDFYMQLFEAERICT